MLASCFARSYAMYALTTGHYRGANLVVPNFFVPVSNELQSHHNLTNANMCSVTPQTSAEPVPPADRRIGSDHNGTKPVPRHGENNSSKPEIKFSIDRILSFPSYKEEKLKESDEDTDVLKDDGEMKPSEENEFDVTDDAMKYSWLQCTRYKPPKLQRSRRKEGGKKRKLGRNPRVPFTQYQVATLEQKFAQTHYLSSIDVADLSTALSLTETRVKIWFQNRRARERRDRDSELRSCSGLGQGRGQTILYAPPSSAPGSSWGLTVPQPRTSLTRLQKVIQHGTSAFTPVAYSGGGSS